MIGHNPKSHKGASQKIVIFPFVGITRIRFNGFNLSLNRLTFVVPTIKHPVNTAAKVMIFI